MMPPPPPPKRRNAPPPPPPRNPELDEVRREDSYVRPFVEGRFSEIPPAYLAKLHDYCREMAPHKPDVSIGQDLDEDTLNFAVFCFTDFPKCSWVQASRQLLDVVRNGTPFAAIHPRCVEWLKQKCEYDAAIERGGKDNS